ncbi:MAG: hypothetical protein AB7N99_06785 [Simkaniaceae bacterium]
MQLFVQMSSQPPQQKPPERAEWVLPPWLKEVITWVDERLNYLDLITFALGALLIFFILYFLLKRKKKVHAQAISEISHKYEGEIKKIRESHLEEIHKAEVSIKAFKKELEQVEAEYARGLEKQEKEYQENMQFAEKQHTKRIHELERGHVKAHSTADMSIFELKQEINRLRTKQLDEVEVFQGEIAKLKEEISSLHDNHTKQIEQSELEISDLRKQLRALMYKV